MKFPKFFRREVRESYSDRIVNEIVDRSYSRSKTSKYAIAALEAASGLVGRAFASADIEATDLIRSALSPSLLQLIGRQLIRRGEFLGLIQVKDSGVLILPCETSSITGGVDPRSWMYNLTVAAPSSTETKIVAAAEVIHVRYAVSSERSWRGLSPIDVATLAGDLSAEVSQALKDESSGPRGSLLPVPGIDGSDSTLSELRSQIRNLGGNTALVESQSTILANSQQSGIGWETRRIGANFPTSLVSLHEQAFNQVLSCIGINPSLLTHSDGASLRESWRQFLFSTIAPLGRILSAELSDKLDNDVAFQWRELRASDIQNRSRSLGSLVSAGMELSEARRIVGLEATGD